MMRLGSADAPAIDQALPKRLKSAKLAIVPFIAASTPASAASTSAGDGAALTLVMSVLATLFGIALTLSGTLFLAIAATRALYRHRTTYDEHGLPRRRDHQERRP